MTQKEGVLPYINKGEWMRKLSWLAVFAVAIFGVVAGGWSAPASATEGDCKTVTVPGRVSKDSGLSGDWADTTVTRVTTVCATSVPGSYKATVTDSGEFVTLAGAKSPGEKASTLEGGVHGTINGGFTATFTAPEWDGTLTPPAVGTPTGEWVAAAFPGTEVFGPAGAVAGWRWVYNLCGEKGEWWINQDTSLGGNSGDITEKACPVAPTPTPTTEPTGQPTPTATATPSASQSASATPSQSGSATPTPSSTTTGAPTASASASVVPGAVDGGTGSGGLPVTGARVLAVAGFGGLLVAAGGLMLVWYKRREDDAVDIA